MFRIRFPAAIAGVFLLCRPVVAEMIISDDDPLALPPVGAHQLRIVAPDILELTLITTKPPDPARISQWDFSEGGRLRAPAASDLQVLVNGNSNAIQSIGFKRRALFAPLKQRDLRIGNYLYLKLDSPIPENSDVEVQNANRKFWPADMHFTAKATPLRWSPAIHVNQIGYLPN